jgi:hypothetical protein
MPHSKLGPAMIAQVGGSLCSIANCRPVAAGEEQKVEGKERILVKLLARHAVSVEGSGASRESFRAGVTMEVRPGTELAQF